MPDVTVSTDVDSLLKSADNAAARTSLGLGTAAEAATGDFATSAQGATADSALQPSDNITELTNNAGFITSAGNLDDVTTNGATTTNDINVGNRITTGNNTASGATATAIGGQNNTASGLSAEVLGGDGSTASGQGSSVLGGSNHQNAGNWSATVGGLNQTVASGAVRSAIVAGFNHNMNHNDCVILGGNTITTDSSNTVYTPNLKVNGNLRLPTGANDGYVLTSNATGTGTWQEPASVSGGVQTKSTSAGVLNIDYSLGANVKTTLTENVTSINISNAVEGDAGLIIFDTDGLGTYSMTVGASNRVLSGYVADFSLLSTGDKITMGYYYDGSAMYLYISQLG